MKHQIIRRVSFPAREVAAKNKKCEKCIKRHINTLIFFLIMDVDYSSASIKINKVLNQLDRFTIDFCSMLEEANIKYVLISGYISILFGRNRSSEDIDLIIEDLNFDRFLSLWNILLKKYDCLNTKNAKKAYQDYLLTKHAIRFSKKKEFIPNIEMKFPKIELELWVVKNRRKVFLNGKKLYISPLELQIPFKLFLGSEKDIEDAKHLYELFKDNLDKVLLNEFNRKLKITDIFNRYVK
ncbi:MAG: hypothetical protein KJ583_01290 [Nanoarchaeota archaeon]|nr:hypothetical protein [Nanoarchaeota archaeon]MBU1270032.1 hypothetical protein [Nanoarchaeota archaeon]MBU1603926.1 hypothetical protein [Nanoarchaeota archaeon]